MGSNTTESSREVDVGAPLIATWGLTQQRVVEVDSRALIAMGSKNNRE
jgi:hypothetical protein